MKPRHDESSRPTRETPRLAVAGRQAASQSESLDCATLVGLGRLAGPELRAGITQTHQALLPACSRWMAGPELRAWSMRGRG